MNDSKETAENRASDEAPRDALMAAAASLPKEIKPGRDLWPGIEQKLHHARAGAWKGRGPFNSLFARAAAVLLVIGASSGLTYFAVKDDGSRVSPVVTDVARVFEPVSGSFGSRYNLGPDFQDARDSLASRLEVEMQKLSPESRAEVQQSLDTIHSAIVEINKALADEPDNVLLQDLLLRTYHNELALMQKVGGIRNSAMRRTDI